jgi:hypothetical protein
VCFSWHNIWLQEFIRSLVALAVPSAIMSFYISVCIENLQRPFWRENNKGGNTDVLCSFNWRSKVVFLRRSQYVIEIFAIVMETTRKKMKKEQKPQPWSHRQIVIPSVRQTCRWTTGQLPIYFDDFPTDMPVNTYLVREFPCIYYILWVRHSPWNGSEKMHMSYMS